MAESDDIRAEDARTAAQIEADVGVEHIADIYAKALLGATENAGKTAEVLEEFDSLVRDVLNAFPDFEAVLTSGLIGHDEKVGTLDRVLGGRVSPLLLDFLKVVSRHGRLDCLRAIHCQTRHMYDKLQGRIEIELTTAAPIDAQVTETIIEKLRDVLGAEPLLRTTVDPNVIGGLVLRIGRASCRERVCQYV